MAARLGNVLYWLGCGIAGICALFVVGVPLGRLVFSEQMHLAEALGISAISAVLGAVCWLAGRALRYILAGT